MRTALLFVLLFAGAAHAQSNPGDRDRAELLGALVHTRVTGVFEQTPAREAFRAMSHVIGVPVQGRYLDDRTGHGIDPDVEVTLVFEDVDALLVLELLLEQCEVYEPCTWQLRRGMVEVGTKQRLAAPAAIERRMYQIRDLMLEPPYFVGPSLCKVLSGGSGGPTIPVDDFYRHPYHTAALTRPADVVDGTARKMPDALADEIVQDIVQTVEPGNWDYGQFDEDEEQTASGRRPPRSYAQRTKIALIRRWEDRLVIRAPDFVQRQVGGYPRPIPPRPLSAEERAARVVVDDSNGIQLRAEPAKERRR